jgi:hypothetical protein
MFMAAAFPEHYRPDFNLEFILSGTRLTASHLEMRPNPISTPMVSLIGNKIHAFMMSLHFARWLRHSRLIGVICMLHILRDLTCLQKEMASRHLVAHSAPQAGYCRRSVLGMVFYQLMTFESY